MLQVLSCLLHAIFSLLSGTIYLKLDQKYFLEGSHGDKTLHSPSAYIIEANSKQKSFLEKFRFHNWKTI